MNVCSWLRIPCFSVNYAGVFRNILEWDKDRKKVWYWDLGRQLSLSSIDWKHEPWIQNMSAKLHQTIKISEHCRRPSAIPRLLRSSLFHRRNVHCPSQLLRGDDLSYFKMASHNLIDLGLYMTVCFFCRKGSYLCFQSTDLDASCKAFCKNSF